MNLKSLKVKDGIDVGVCSFVYGNASVIFDTSAIEKLSELEIGQIAKSLRNEAEEFNLCEIADSIERYGFGGSGYTIDESTKQRFLIYTGENPTILCAKSLILQEIERRKIKELIKTEKKRKRSEISSGYHKRFFRIGQRDGFRCKHCGTDKDLQIDHVIPLDKRGSNDDSNLQLLCRSCNSKKGAK